MAAFMKNISLVAQSVSLFRDEKLKHTGVTGFQVKYLLAVDNDEGVSQDKLAKQLFVNKSNVARQISALEAAGFVRREQSDEDKRVFRLYLTEKGKAVCPEIRRVNAEWHSVVCAGISEEEKELLSSLMERLVENAKNYMVKTSTENITEKPQ